MQMANQAYNATPLSSHTGKQSPNKIFDNSAVDINQKHWKPFGCPVYVLKAELQGTTEEMSNPILAYKAVNPVILRLHEAMQAKDQRCSRLQRRRK